MGVFSRSHLAALLAACAAPARAAGGAHVVDDSELELPGTCHAELSATALSGHGRLVADALGCTNPAFPIELGGYALFGRSGGVSDGEIGLAPKISFQSASPGRVGIAIEGMAGLGVRHGRLETASLIVPLTFTLSRIVQINVNGGFVRAAADHVFRGFGGTQIVAQISPRWQLMAEAFGLTGLKAGGQAGVRWTFDRGRMDLDLLAARYVDGIARNALTIGVIIRH